MTIDDEKRHLREVARQTRKQISAHAKAGDHDAFQNNLLQVLTKLPDWNNISGYLAIGDEINLAPVLKSLRDNGKVCLLPVVIGKAQPLLFRVWEADTELEQGPLNTRHPAGGAATGEPDILLVPLLAFDKSGYRLGWGGGFYDRTLGEYIQRGRPIISIGVGYADQEVVNVPHDGYDVALDWIVTETGVRKTTANKKVQA